MAKWPHGISTTDRALSMHTTQMLSTNLHVQCSAKMFPEVADMASVVEVRSER